MGSLISIPGAGKRAGSVLHSLPTASRLFSNEKLITAAEVALPAAGYPLEAIAARKVAISAFTPEGGS
jgi:hypothetical protein